MNLGRSTNCLPFLIISPIVGFIKAAAFASNGWALAELTKGVSPTLQVLCVASAFSGTVL